MKFTPADFVGLAGILPTPSTPDGDRWDTEQSVNLPESEKMTRLVVEAGTDIILANGTFGEGATLTEDEHRAFTACVIDTIAGRKPFFAGITTLNTRDTIRRGRELMDMGATGLFVGRPMWLAMDDAGIIRFYRDLAEAMPGVPLIVYDNGIAFKGKISPAAFDTLADIPEVVAAKHTGGPTLMDDARLVGERCRILPLASAWYESALAEPELMKSAWTGSIACAPAPLVALSRAILSQDWDRAKAVSEQCNWAEAAMFAGGDLAKFMDYSIQIAHLRFKHAGLIDPGPPRPPYLELPEAYLAGGTECGRRWAQLQAEYTREAVTP